MVESFLFTFKHHLVLWIVGVYADGQHVVYTQIAAHPEVILYAVYEVPVFDSP